MLHSLGPPLKSIITATLITMVTRVTLAQRPPLAEPPAKLRAESSS